MLNKQLKAQYDITEFKKMKVTIRDMDNRKKAISDLKKQRLNVAVSGGVIKVDGRGKDLNNIAKDLMNFYGANVVAEEVELDEAIKYKFVAVDTKGKIIGFSSKESDAKDMARRNNGEVHKLKKPMAQKVGDMEINKALILY